MRDLSRFEFFQYPNIRLQNFHWFSDMITQRIYEYIVVISRIKVPPGI